MVSLTFLASTERCKGRFIRANVRKIFDCGARILSNTFIDDRTKAREGDEKIQNTYLKVVLCVTSLERKIGQEEDD